MMRCFVVFKGVVVKIVRKQLPNIHPLSKIEERMQPETPAFKMMTQEVLPLFLMMSASFSAITITFPHSLASGHSNETL
jgi:hypothetical protein